MLMYKPRLYFIYFFLESIFDLNLVSEFTDLTAGKDEILTLLKVSKI